MAVTIPYIGAAGSIGKILEKIKEASTPENFSSDFLDTKLGFKGGNYRMFISWAKKLGLLNSDGTPTILYKQFRNPSTSGSSLAEAFRIGYSELYSRNEYCHELDKKGLKGLVMEATGEAHDSQKVNKIVDTFFNAKALADFDAKNSSAKKEPTHSAQKGEGKVEVKQPVNPISNGKNLNLGLNYTINLVLPKTDDPAVYAAIFKTLKENLLDE
ncbi:MAG: DUF5343 domain-containing protein [Bacteroidia bacterium]